MTCLQRAFGFRADDFLQLVAVAVDPRHHAGGEGQGAAAQGQDAAEPLLPVGGIHGDFVQGAEESLARLERVLGPAAFLHFLQERLFAFALLVQALAHDAVDHAHDEEDRNANEMAFEEHRGAYREIKHGAVEGGNDGGEGDLQLERAHRCGNEDDQEIGQVEIGPQLFGGVDDAGGDRGVDEEQDDREGAALDHADRQEEGGRQQRQEPEYQDFLDGAGQDGFRGIENLIGEHDRDEALQHEDLDAVAAHAYLGLKG